MKVSTFQVRWAGYAEDDFLVVDTNTKQVIKRYGTHLHGVSMARTLATHCAERLNRDNERQN